MHSVGWDCCALHSPTHLLVINGGISLIVVLMDPLPQCSGLYMVIGVICNILFFGVIHLSLCLEPRCAAPLGGSTTVVLTNAFDNTQAFKRLPYQSVALKLLELLY